MHLTKEDIGHVGFHRYDKAHGKQNIIVMVCLAVAVIAGGLSLTHLYPGNQWVSLWVGIPIIILAIVWVAMYTRAQLRSAQELIKQCELDPYLIYVSGQEAATAKDEATNLTK